jgi:hypothetical protein
MAIMESSSPVDHSWCSLEAFDFGRHEYSGDTNQKTGRESRSQSLYFAFKEKIEQSSPTMILGRTANPCLLIVQEGR